MLEERKGKREDNQNLGTRRMSPGIDALKELGLAATAGTSDRA